MNIEELEQEIKRVRILINNTNSYKLKNDLSKYLKKLNKERKDYYTFRRLKQ